jgi:hypothetical protein
VKCALPGCGADSIELDQASMNCMGNGATSGATGLWCIAGWQRTWSGEYPDYEKFLQAKPWEPRGL